MTQVASALPVARTHVKHGRDRFVAFSFAAADVLVELDAQHRIEYIDGATLGFLGALPQQWLGKEFSSLIAKEDCAKYEEAIQQASLRGRINQCRLHLTTKYYKSLPVMLSGLRLPSQENHLYITLTVLTQEMNQKELQERDIESGLFHKEDFAIKAQQRILEEQEAGRIFLV
jgi:PAS domain-containing protein